MEELVVGGVATHGHPVAAIGDLTGLATLLNVVGALNDILAALREHGIIEP